MLRLVAGLALAVLALTACHPGGNNLVPASRSVMDGDGGPPTKGAVVASPTPAPTIAPMDGDGGPPTP
jgi:hypothetical protein